ncbi:MAG: HAD-IA family hydrolase [Candidatus Woesearchaeota archaeon]
MVNKFAAVLADVFGTLTPPDFPNKLLADFFKKGGDFVHPDDITNAALLFRLAKESNLFTPKEISDYIARKLEARIITPDYLEFIGHSNIESYRTGTLKGEVCDDVPPAFHSLRDAGKAIYLFSNSFAPALRLLLRTATPEYLDLLVDDYFDTLKTGPKEDSKSYSQIAKSIGLPPSTILYVDDKLDGLVAAEMAGMQVAHISRPGAKPAGMHNYRTINNLLEVL